GGGGGGGGGGGAVGRGGGIARGAECDRWPAHLQAGHTSPGSRDSDRRGADDGPRSLCGADAIRAGALSDDDPMMLSTSIPESLRLLDAYWRAANYLAVGQIYLLDNPLLTDPLQ